MQRWVWTGLSFCLVVAAEWSCGVARAAPSDGGIVLPFDGGASGLEGGALPPPVPCSVTTSFLGDARCILPPARGFQLHFGPTDYQNPNGVVPYVVDSGSEEVRCVFMKTPNDAPVDASAFQFRARDGVAHDAVWLLPASRPDAGPVPCGNALDGAVRVWLPSSQSEQDLNLENGAPENRGLAWRIPPHAQIAFQAHDANTTLQPLLQEAWLNVIETGSATGHVDAIDFRGDGPAVPPLATVVSSFSAPAPATVRVVSLAGMMSGRVLRLSAYVLRRSGSKDLIYEAHDWRDTPSLQFDGVTTNPGPTAGTYMAGGASGIVQLAPGDSLTWECEIQNGGIVPASYDPTQVFAGVQCDLVGIYAASTAVAWKYSGQSSAGDAGIGTTGAGGTSGSGTGGTSGAASLDASVDAAGTPVTAVVSDAGSDAATGAPSPAKGCSCRVVPGAPTPTLWLLSASLTLAFAGARRRAGKSRR